jgi:hypothetical protein
MACHRPIYRHIHGLRVDACLPRKEGAAMVAATHEEWSADLLNPFFEGFGDHLTVTGLAPATMDYMLRVAHQFGRWLEDSGRCFESIDSDVIQEFIKTKNRATYAGCTYQSMC